jgi:hypothetical protein
MNNLFTQIIGGIVTGIIVTILFAIIMVKVF